MLCEPVRVFGENDLLPIFLIVTVSSSFMLLLLLLLPQRPPDRVGEEASARRAHARTHSHTRSRVHTHSQVDRFLSNLGFFVPSLPAIPHGLERPCRVGNPQNPISKAPVPRADG